MRKEILLGYHCVGCCLLVIFCCLLVIFCSVLVFQVLSSSRARGESRDVSYLEPISENEKYEIMETFP